MAAAVTQDKLNDPVTKHMRRDPATVGVDETVGQVLETLREKPPQDRIIYFYVVDTDNVLRGVVPTRRLLLSPLNKPIREVMIEKVVALPDSASVLDACEFFIQHRFLALPVVDGEKRLLGVVDVELYTEEITHLGDSRERDDLFQLIGIHAAQAQQGGALMAFRLRFPWLLCNVGGGILAAFLTGMFEKELTQVVQLSLFIPVVLALSESVSIQSVSLALRHFQRRAPTWLSLLPQLSRELQTGVLLGLGTAVLVALVVLLWLGQMQVFLCVLGGISLGVTASALIGLGMPSVLRIFHVEPQVAAGPICLVLADMMTLMLYFGLARWLLS